MESLSFSPEENSLHADGLKQNLASQTPWRGAKHARYNRIIIYPKDIQLITGKSERYGRMMLRRVKDHFHKANHHLVTVDEFCEYTGIGVEVVRGLLGGWMQV
jgi:hypothetical protein